MEKYIIIFIILIILYFLFFNCDDIEKIANTSTDKLNSDLVDSITNLGLLAKDIQKPSGLTLPASLVVINDIDVSGSANIKGNMSISGTINCRSKATIKDVDILTSTYKFCTDISFNSYLLTTIGNIPFKSISRIEIALHDYGIACFHDGTYPNEVLNILINGEYGTSFHGYKWTIYEGGYPMVMQVNTPAFNKSNIYSNGNSYSLIRPGPRAGILVTGKIDISIISSNTINVKIDLCDIGNGLFVNFQSNVLIKFPNLSTANYIQIVTYGSGPLHNTDNIYVKYYY
jgi:hypothetical protein